MGQGHIVHAAEVCIRLGEILTELGDLDGAESAYRQAVALARQVAIEGIARQAIGMLDEICMHDLGQALQRHAADTLRCVGRDVEADQWQAEADTYEDWSAFMDQQIPGHVHLWDIRFDLSARPGLIE